MGVSPPGFKHGEFGDEDPFRGICRRGIGELSSETFGCAHIELEGGRRVEEWWRGICACVETEIFMEHACTETVFVDGGDCAVGV